MNLTPQQQKVVNYLQDGKWHCMANDFFIKDDRKRISELNRMGFNIIGFKCDRTCGIKHSSRVLMRKMKGVPKDYIAPEMPLNAPVSLEIAGLWYETDPWTGMVLEEREHEIYA